MGFEKVFQQIKQPNPLVVVISGLSGAGKDSVIEEMKKRECAFHFVITTTSRAPRPGEQDGKDYLFVSKERFDEMIARDELFEHAMVYGQQKGVSKDQVRKALTTGKDVLMRLDVQGAARVRQQNPDAVLIFLTTESEEVLLQRLRRRQTDTEEALELRIVTARQELERLPEFDYVVVNAEGQLDKTVDIIEAIIEVEHHRVHQRRITL